MNLAKLILSNFMTAMLLVPVFTFASEGTNSGGGGGGVCENGTCQTLAEIGVRVGSQILPTYRIEPEVLAELSDITKNIPKFGKMILELAKYNGDLEDPILRRVDKLSSESLRKIEKGYKAVLKKSGHAQHQKNPQLYARTKLAVVTRLRRIFCRSILSLALDRRHLF